MGSMVDRERFKSLWNGSALIIFFAGIFLNFRGFGIGATGLAIFMWIIGSTVEDMIYGPKKKKKGRPNSDGTVDASASSRSSVICSNCGIENPSNSDFCMECGTSLIRSSSATSPGLKKSEK